MYNVYKQHEIACFSYPVLNSNMYIMCRGAQALLIDANPSVEGLDYLRKRGIRDITLLLTHEHYDHTFGYPSLFDKYSVRVICHEQCAYAILQKRNNRPIVLSSIIMSNPELHHMLECVPQGYIIEPTVTFVGKHEFIWNDCKIIMVETPGHSNGSCCIDINQQYFFTGDSWILDTPVITRFPTGSLALFNRMTAPYLESIPVGSRIFPGHGMNFVKTQKLRMFSGVLPCRKDVEG